MRPLGTKPLAVQPAQRYQSEETGPGDDNCGIALPRVPQEQLEGERARHYSNDHSNKFLSSLHAQPRSVQPEEGHKPERDDGSRKQRYPPTIGRGGRHEHGSQQEPRPGHCDDVNDQEPNPQATPFLYELLSSGGVLLGLRNRRDGGRAHIDPIVGQPILETREHWIYRWGQPVRAELSHIYAWAPSQPVGLCHSIPCRDSSLRYRLPRMELCPSVAPLVPPMGEILIAKTSCASSPENTFFLCVFF